MQHPKHNLHALTAERYLGPLRYLVPGSVQVIDLTTGDTVA